MLKTIVINVKEPTIEKKQVPPAILLVSLSLAREYVSCQQDRGEREPLERGTSTTRYIYNAVHLQRGTIEGSLAFQISTSTADYLTAVSSDFLILLFRRVVPRQTERIIIIIIIS